VAALHHHDALALKVLDGADQRLRRHVVELGVKLGARPPLVVVIAQELQDNGTLNVPRLGAGLMLSHGTPFCQPKKTADKAMTRSLAARGGYGSCVASKAISSVSTGRAGVRALARPMFDLDCCMSSSIREGSQVESSTWSGSGSGQQVIGHRNAFLSSSRAWTSGDYREWLA
jgi:hypothetical protein